MLLKFVPIILLLFSHISAAVPITLSNPLIQGGLVYGQVPIGSIVKLDNNIVRVNKFGQFIIGFGRDAKPQSILEVTTVDGKTRKKTLTVEQRSYRTQRVNGVPQRTVTPKPDPEFLKRVRKESALVREARTINSDLTGYLSTFQWPLIGPITGVYGSQRVYNGTPKRPHFGVDIAAPRGTIVTAPAPGIVRLTYKDMFYSGGTLIVDHGFGLSSSFIHLNDILVKEGDTVTAGQAIAKVGSTGRSTGPHLDWRLNWLNVRLDPQLVVAPMPEKSAAK